MRDANLEHVSTMVHQRYSLELYCLGPTQLLGGIGRLRGRFFEVESALRCSLELSGDGACKNRRRNLSLTSS